MGSATASAGLRYDVEGLRAIAIVAVLLFHFELLGAQGGFAGVDIFFVISGFLITGMLTGHGPVSFADIKEFAVKRVWRIAPAYYAILLLTLAGVLLLLPHDRRDGGFAAIAAAFFVSNFYFTNTAGYFAGFAIHKPFLHTWSLAVEVQFYLLWPFLFLAMRRQAMWQQFLIVGALTVASFLVSVILSFSDDKVAFYALPSRLWEFGFGALAALLPRVPAFDRFSAFLSHYITQAAAFLALLISPWSITDTLIWPAPAALAPVLATACLIAGGKCGEGWPQRFLASAPMVWVGRLSYSLYLTHWPIAVFLNYFMPPMPSWPLRAGGIIASLCSAIVLFRMIEQPARRIGRQALIAVRPLTWLAAVPIASALCAMTIVNFLGERRSDQAHTMPCAATVMFAGAARCVVGDAQAEPDVIVWGDSHAQHFAPGFEGVLKPTQRAAIIVSTPTCPPVLDAQRAFNTFRQDRRCAQTNKAVFDAVRSKPRFYDVYLAARWAFYTETTKFGREHIQRVFLVNDAQPSLSQEATQSVFRAGLLKAVAALTDAATRTAIIAQVPEMGFDAGHCVRVLQRLQRDGSVCAVPLSQMRERTGAMQSELQSLAQRFAGVRIFSAASALCDETVCRAALDGQPAYSDGDHITRAASIALVQRWANSVRR